VEKLDIEIDCGKIPKLIDGNARATQTDADLPWAKADTYGRVKRWRAPQKRETDRGAEHGKGDTCSAANIAAQSGE